MSQMPLDLPMDEPKSKPEEIRDIPSNKKDVEPHDLMKEETIIPIDMDQEASKENDVVSQDSDEKGIYYSPRSSPKGELGGPGGRGGDSRTIRTSRSRQARIGGSNTEFIKNKGSLDYIVKKKKPSSIASQW
jgi:hypothetical protein